MDGWVDERIMVMTDTDKKPWHGKLISDTARGITVEIDAIDRPTEGPFKGLQSESEIQMFIPWSRVRVVARGQVKGIL